MLEVIWLVVFALTFLVAYKAIGTWINIANREGFAAKDMNKYSKPLVPVTGGLGVLAAFVFGVLLYVGISIFYFRRPIHLVEIFAILTTLLIIAFIGLLDEYMGGWKKGLKQWQKPLITLPAALPLMAIRAGVTAIFIPILGKTNFAWAYPLIVVPMGIVGASQGFNMLAGLNGLESSMASVIIATLGYVAWAGGENWLAIMCIIMLVSLFAFLLYNKFPAKVFPGDSLLYPLGAFIASVAILGDMERTALILFIPYFIELCLKARYRMKTESFLIPRKDGTVSPPERISSLTHVSCLLVSKFKKNVYEKDVVNLLVVFEVILAVVALSIF